MIAWVYLVMMWLPKDDRWLVIEQSRHGSSSVSIAAIIYPVFYCQPSVWSLYYITSRLLTDIVGTQWFIIILNNGYQWLLAMHSVALIANNIIIDNVIMSMNSYYLSHDRAWLQYIGNQEQKGFRLTNNNGDEAATEVIHRQADLPMAHRCWDHRWIRWWNSLKRAILAMVVIGQQRMTSCRRVWQTAHPRPEMSKSKQSNRQ